MKAHDGTQTYLCFLLKAAFRDTHARSLYKSNMTAGSVYFYRWCQKHTFIFTDHSDQWDTGETETRKHAWLIIVPNTLILLEVGWMKCWWFKHDQTGCRPTMRMKKATLLRNQKSTQRRKLWHDGRQYLQM